MKIRKKVNGKGLFPAFYRIKKRNSAKDKIKSGSAANLRIYIIYV